MEIETQDRIESQNSYYYIKKHLLKLFQIQDISAKFFEILDLPQFDPQKGMRIYILKVCCFLIRNLIFTNILVKNLHCIYTV